MKTNSILSDNIDLYVRGKLHGADASALEELIKTDKSVAGEVELQKSITKVIKHNRASMLKARLEQIPMSSMMQVSHSATFTAWKAASVILASAGLGLGAYFYVNNRKIENGSLSTISVAQQEPIAENSPKLPEEKQLAFNSTNVEAEKSDITAKSEKSEIKSEIKKSTVNLKESPKNASTKKVPNMDSFDDTSQSEVKSDNEDAPKDIKTKSTQLVASDVDIKNIQDGSHKFHYKLKNNVLFLYGSFEASPYEILEFNDKSSQVLYLYYDQSFFAMTPNQADITKLKKIADKKLITDLELARSR